MTFDYRRVYKKEADEFYVNAIIEGNGTIKSNVGNVDIVITTEDIREEYKLPEASDLDVSSHSFNQNLFWEDFKKKRAPSYEKFSGKKKILLKPVWERAIDII